MSELHDKARALLALSDKATPGPWKAEYWESLHQVHGWHRYSCVELPDHPNSPRALNVIDCVVEANRTTFDPIDKANAEFIAAAHDMADTIRELLAENERLRRWRDLALKYDAERMQQRARAEVAEARLRDLANEEPAMWARPNYSFAVQSGNSVENEILADNGLVPLILRPTL